MFVEVLVKEKIEAGWAALEALRQSAFPIVGAFWCRIPESGYWTLIIASPRVRDAGPLAAFHEVRLILEAHGLERQIFSDLALFSPGDPEYLRLYQHAVGTNRFGIPPAAGIPRNLSFEDAWLYL